jgi:hypothetical protein
MNPLDQVVKDFCAECLDDYVGLWSLLRRIQAAVPKQTPSQYQRLTLQVLRPLLVEGTVVVGQPTIEKVFQPWPRSPQEALDAIQSEWVKLGREPSIGDIAWFTAAAELQPPSAHAGSGQEGPSKPAKSL